MSLALDPSDYNDHLVFKALSQSQLIVNVSQQRGGQEVSQRANLEHSIHIRIKQSAHSDSISHSPLTPTLTFISHTHNISLHATLLIQALKSRPWTPTIKARWNTDIFFCIMNTSECNSEMYSGALAVNYMHYNVPLQN